MKIRLLAFISLLGFYSLSAHAIVVSGLYQTSVPVADESLVARAGAMQQALRLVLIKLSGNKNIASDSGANTIINNAKKYVQQFRYTWPDVADIGVEALPKLQVKFNEAVLNKAMRDYGLRLWGKERAGVLVWLAYNSPAGRRVATFEGAPDLLGIIDKAASSRGVPVVFPLLDLEDTSGLSVSDIWGGFQQPIIAASARYQSDAVFAGRLSQTQGGLWESHWYLFIGQQVNTWSTVGDTDAQALEKAVHKLADQLATRYVNSGSGSAEVVEIQISNINNYDQYARVLTYLESLQPVTRVMVTAVTPSRVIFEITSHDGAAAFYQAVRLGAVLSPIDGETQHSYSLQAGY